MQLEPETSASFHVVVGIDTHKDVHVAVAIDCRVSALLAVSAIGHY